MLSRLSARAIFKPQSFYGLSYARPASTEVVKTEDQPAAKKFIESSCIDFDPEKPVTQLKAEYIPLFQTKKEGIVLQREAVYQPNIMNLYQQDHHMSSIHRRFYSTENDIRYSLKEMLNDVNKTLNELKTANCDSRLKLEEFKTEMVKAYQESRKEFSKEIKEIRDSNEKMRETRDSNEKMRDIVSRTYILSAISATGVVALTIREIFLFIAQS